jgi:hypothetical protein
MSEELETLTPAPLPDLVRPQRGGALSGAHITLPRLYKGEKSSDAFGEGLVPLGSIYVGQGADDPDPEVITEEAATKETPSSTVRAHVLAVKLGLSLKEGNNLRTWAYFDKSAPADARETFDYTVLLPEVDPDIPVKVLISSTSTQTAKRMNFVLLGLEDETRWPEVAFDISVKYRERTEGGSKQTWYVWQARQVQDEDVNPEHVKLAKAAAQRFDAIGDVTPPAVVDTRPEI